MPRTAVAVPPRIAVARPRSLKSGSSATRTAIPVVIIPVLRLRSRNVTHASPPPPAYHCPTDGPTLEPIESAVRPPTKRASSFTPSSSVRSASPVPTGSKVLPSESSVAMAGSGRWAPDATAGDPTPLATTTANTAAAPRLHIMAPAYPPRSDLRVKDDRGAGCSRPTRNSKSKHQPRRVVLHAPRTAANLGFDSPDSLHPTTRPAYLDPRWAIRPRRGSPSG